MFSGFMVNTWLVATLVALVAGVVGCFVVMRGSAFVAHAVPQAGFAGAAAASLLGISVFVGLGVFALVAALGIGWLSRRGRHDVATALALVMMLGLGALFLSFTTEYEPEIFSLVFGEVLGVAANEVLPTALLGLACVVAVAVLYRPLLLTSVLAEVGEARGVRAYRVALAFLVVVALVTTMSVPVVGTLLVFSLMIGPPAAAQAVTAEPARAMALSVVLALVTVWGAIAASYATNWPVGFFVGVFGALVYVAGRLWAARAPTRARRSPGAAAGSLAVTA